MWIPLATYAVNIAFAMVLSAGVGLWMPVVLSAVLGLLPAAFAALAGAAARRQPASGGSRMPDVAWSFLQRSAKQVVRRNLDLTVEGLEQVPQAGPAILAARHVHHLYDGCAILATIPRPVHIVVALDWVTNRPGRLAMDRLCAAARWPVVLRQDGPRAVAPGEAARAWRTAMKARAGVAEEGRIVLVFPEGYPNIDPGYTPKPDEDAFLPFQPGVRAPGLDGQLRACTGPGDPGGIPLPARGQMGCHDALWRATSRSRTAPEKGRPAGTRGPRPRPVGPDRSVSYRTGTPAVTAGRSRMSISSSSGRSPRRSESIWETPSPPMVMP